jgi:hypothetical protein
MIISLNMLIKLFVAIHKEKLLSKNSTILGPKSIKKSKNKIIHLNGGKSIQITTYLLRKKKKYLITSN